MSNFQGARALPGLPRPTKKFEDSLAEGSPIWCPLSLARLPEAAAEVDAAVRAHGMRLRRGHESLELRAALEQRCEELDTLYNAVAHHCDAPLLEAQRAKLQACLFGQPQHFLSSAEELLREAWTIVTSGEALLSRAASTPPHEVHNKALWRQLASSRYTCAEHINALGRARSGAGPDAAIDAWVQCLESLKRRLDTALASGDGNTSRVDPSGTPGGQGIASLTPAGQGKLTPGGHVFAFHLSPEEHQEFLRRMGSSAQGPTTQPGRSGQQRSSLIPSGEGAVDEWVQQCMDSLKTNLSAKSPTAGSNLQHKHEHGEHTFVFKLKEDQYQEYLRRGGAQATSGRPQSAPDSGPTTKGKGKTTGSAKGTGKSGGKATTPQRAPPQASPQASPEPEFEETPGKSPGEPEVEGFDDDDETF